MLCPRILAQALVHEDLIDQDTLRFGPALKPMHKDTVLVTTCHGRIADEGASLEALKAGHLRAACFDAFAIEPAKCDRLSSNPGTLATPHIGAVAKVIRILMAGPAIRGLEGNELVVPETHVDD